MKIIGLEEHTLSKEIAAANRETISSVYPYYKTFLTPLPDDSTSFEDLFVLGQRRIDEMDKAGIDMEVLSFPNATQWLQGEEAISLSQKANDFLNENVKAFPDRFRAFATLPWSNPQAAIDELKRTVNELGFVGTLISGRPQTGNVFLDDKIYDPIWQTLTELDLPIYIHPNYPTLDLCKSYYSGFSDRVNMIFSTFGFGWHLEAGIQVLRMILGGVFDRFPTLKVISGHWGEVVPYYLPRFDMTFKPEYTGLTEKVSTYFKRNVWITPGGIYDYDDMQYCINKLGIDHLLFATDFPYIPMTDAKSFVDNAPLNDAEKEKFAHLNAEKLLHLS